MKSQKLLLMLVILTIYGMFSVFLLSSKYDEMQGYAVSIYNSVYSKGNSSVLLNQTLASEESMGLSKVSSYEYYCLRKKAIFSSEEYSKYWKYK